MTMIAGIKGISLIDYPHKVATVLYLSHCNFRCPFCHNSQLVLNSSIEAIEPQEIMRTIAERRDFIDGVVITGGEPTVYRGLTGLAEEIKALGLPVKLDTNGYNPGTLKMLLNRRVIDFVAMDIKSSRSKYGQAAGIDLNYDRILESINLIKEAHVDYEFRTTCVPDIVDEYDIEEISRLAGSSAKYTLQQFQSENTLDPGYSRLKPYTRETLLRFKEIAAKNVALCRLIGV